MIDAVPNSKYGRAEKIRFTNQSDLGRPASLQDLVDVRRSAVRVADAPYLDHQVRDFTQRLELEVALLRRKIENLKELAEPLKVNRNGPWKCVLSLTQLIIGMMERDNCVRGNTDCGTVTNAFDFAFRHQKFGSNPATSVELRSLAPFAPIRERP
jgi:hypothetical protein